MPDAKPSLWRTLTRLGILAGILAILLAFALYDIFDNARLVSPVVLVPLALGGVLFLGGIVLNLGWLRSSVGGRKFFVGLNVWAMVALSVVLVVIANAVVGGTPQTDAWSFDLTSNHMHTLSPETRNILKGLAQDVHVTVIMGNGQVPVGYTGAMMDLSPQVRELVELYRAQSRKVHVQVLDAYEDKTRVEELAASLNAKVASNSILVECGGNGASAKTVHLPFSDLIVVPPMNPMSEEMPQPAFQGEEKLTSAILNVTEAKQSTVCFLTGHGEMGISGSETNALNQFVLALNRDNYRVQTLNLLQAGAIPPDCDLIVIAAPTAPYQPGEVQLLRGYLQKDGALLVLAEPRQEGGSLGGLADLLNDYNVRVRDDETAIEVVRDIFGQVRGSLEPVIQGDEYGRHAVTNDLRNTNCILPMVSPVEQAVRDLSAQSPESSQVTPSPYQVVTLISSSANSWGETDIRKTPAKFDAARGDEKGPLSLGVAVTRRPPSASPEAPAPAAPEAGPRLVVLGSVDAASDQAMQQDPGNRALVMNAVNWLARKETHLGIPPQTSDRRMIVASPAAMKAVFFIAIVAMPLAAVMLGGIFWWFRRA